MHGPVNVKSPNNTSKWQMGFNSAFKGLIEDYNSCSNNIKIQRICGHGMCVRIGIVSHPHICCSRWPLVGVLPRGTLPQQGPLLQSRTRRPDLLDPRPICRRFPISIMVVRWMGGGPCRRPFAHCSRKTCVFASSQFRTILAGTFGKGLCEVSWQFISPLV